MWNTIHKYLVEPFTIKQQEIKLGRITGEGPITLNYDFSTNVSQIKTRMKNILLKIQTFGEGAEWRSYNENLETYF